MFLLIKYKNNITVAKNIPSIFGREKEPNALLPIKFSPLKGGKRKVSTVEKTNSTAIRIFLYKDNKI